ncbi:myb-like protein X [Heracleum sosnowskyi]|uniref:Myb-like protein X n=1 Tax=Heracleum sosnowskyi TaxID=360622 RepID=A0AAD8IBY9_9APIA|nr:myb-like protein X [Heracleum sosnowskyi]
MSRCFPFPPPGYEKKLIPEVASVLKKEKTKEKKHKEKKDKEKKEGKDKRDKEKSNGKHREKKDKKEKHKDRKKDKEKNKEKDQEKGSTSVEKKDFGQGEEFNRAKVHQSENVQDEKKEHISTSEEKRQIGQFGYCNGEKTLQKVEKSREKKNPADEKFAVQLLGQTGGNKTVLHSFTDKDSQDSKFMAEFSKRINDEGKGSGSQLVEGFMDTGFKKVERIDKFAVRDSCTVVEGKEKIKDKQVDNWNINGQRIHHEEKFNGNAMSQNLSGSIQNKIGESKSKDNSEGTMEAKEKSKERERDDKRGEKRKSKHKDKQSKGKDKSSKKEKRKEDKTKKDRQKSEKDNSRISNKNDVGSPNNKTSHFPKDSDKNAAAEGILKKRKDTEKNGFLPEYVIKPEKMPRLDSHPLSENGQDSEPFETTTLFTSKKQGAPNNFDVDNKDNKINGTTGQHQLPKSLAPKPSPVISEQIADALRKPPHPDMKYLSKVLSVPRMDEWSEVDDQEWLFNNKDSLLNKSKLDSVEVKQGQQVWAETLRIESADVFALPYVIPY